MKTRLIPIFFLLLFNILSPLIMIQVNAATTLIFSDNFDDNDVTDWDVSGTGSFTASNGVAVLSDQDTAGSLFAYKSLGSVYTSNSITVIGWVNSTVGGKIGVYDDAANVGTNTGNIRAGLDAGSGNFTLDYWDGSTRQVINSQIAWTSGAWYKIEIIINLDSKTVSCKIYDASGNLIWDSGSYVHGLAQVSVIELEGVGKAKTGDAYFDNIEVYYSTPEWYLDSNGKAVKILPGHSGSVNITVNPGSQQDTITVSVVYNPDSLSVDISPSSFTVSTDPVTVTVTITMPSTISKLVYVIALNFTGNIKTETVWIAVLPIDSSVSKTTIREAPGDGEGYWVGGADVVEINGTYYMVYRYRDPVDRGYMLVIANSSDGLSWTDIKSFNDVDYSYNSFEKASLTAYNGQVLMLYGADTESSGWTIFKTTAATPEDLTLPGTQVSITGYSEKDPEIYYDSEAGIYVIGVSTYNDNPNINGHDAAIAVTNDFTTFTVKISSLVNELIADGNTWAKRAIHIGYITRIGDYYAVFYDVSDDPDDAFLCKLGLALVKTDWSEVIDLTPTAPLWEGYGDGAFRYVSILYRDDYYILYGEEGQSDLSHDLVAYYYTSSSDGINDITEINNTLNETMNSIMSLVISMISIFIVLTMLGAMVKILDKSMEKI